jgi:hypothetical protein
MTLPPDVSCAVEVRPRSMRLDAWMIASLVWENRMTLHLPPPLRSPPPTKRSQTEVASETSMGDPRHADAEEPNPNPRKDGEPAARAQSRCTSSASRPCAVRDPRRCATSPERDTFWACKLHKRYRQQRSGSRPISIPRQPERSQIYLGQLPKNIIWVQVKLN